MEVDSKLILQLKSETGMSLSQCNKALQLFDFNIKQAYKFLEITHNGICYRKPNGEKFNKQDYIDYVKNNKE
jgi:translation elongation factor EF-Ts